MMTRTGLIKAIETRTSELRDELKNLKDLQLRQKCLMNNISSAGDINILVDRLIRYNLREEFGDTAAEWKSMDKLYTKDKYAEKVVENNGDTSSTNQEVRQEDPNISLIDTDNEFTGPPIMTPNGIQTGVHVITGDNQDQDESLRNNTGDNNKDSSRQSPHENNQQSPFQFSLPHTPFQAINQTSNSEVQRSAIVSGQGPPKEMEDWMNSINASIQVMIQEIASIKAKKSSDPQSSVKSPPPQNITPNPAFRPSHSTVVPNRDQRESSIPQQQNLTDAFTPLRPPEQEYPNAGESQRRNQQLRFTLPITAELRERSGEFTPIHEQHYRPYNANNSVFENSMAQLLTEDQRSRREQRVYNSIRNCKLQYSGKIKDDLEDFIQALDECQFNFKITDDELLRSLPIILSGEARTWARGQVWDNVMDFKDDIKKQFGITDFQTKLEEEVNARTQAPGEPIREYLIKIQRLMNKSERRFSNTESLSIIYRNLHPAYAENIPRKQVTSIYDIQYLGELYEARKERTARYKPPPSPENSWFPAEAATPKNKVKNAAVGKEEQEADTAAVVLPKNPPNKRNYQVKKPEEFKVSGRGSEPNQQISVKPLIPVKNTETVSGTDRPKVDMSTVKCWHCQMFGHYRIRCPSMDKKFCYTCGQEGVITTRCPKCNTQNNQEN